MSLPADDAVLGGVGTGVGVADALLLGGPDQPIEEPGCVVPRDGVRNAVGRDVGPDAVEVG